MGRPRPNSAESGDLESGHAGSGNNSSNKAQQMTGSVHVHAQADAQVHAPYPPNPPPESNINAASVGGGPPPPPQQQYPPPPVPEAAVAYPPPPPPVVNGTPVSFPPTVNQYAVTPPHPQNNINVMVGRTGGSPYLQQQIGDPWSSGLFDCNLNENNAVMTAFFPCVTFGQIAEIIDEGQTSCTVGGLMYITMVPALLSCWILGANYRRKLRLKYNLVEAPYEDWAAHLLCPCCALCQEFRELEKRGFNPSDGWMGHLAKQHYTQTAPPQNQFMSN